VESRSRKHKIIKMARKKLTGEESLLETTMIMAEGNSGAAQAIGELMKSEQGIIDMFHLDDMNMRGSQIWVAYKNYCDYNVKKLAKCIRARDEEMIKKVNDLCEEYGETAKTNVGGRR